MRKIPTPPGGSAQWQDGWQNGYEQALMDTEHSRKLGDTGPRTWAIEYPPAPPAGTRVRDKDGDVHEIGKGARLTNEPFSWEDALEHFGPLTEVVETEVEAAARRLRECDLDDSTDGIPLGKDIRTVLAHVLNGGTLP